MSTETKRRDAERKFEEKLIEAMGAVRKAMALVESAADAEYVPESLIGVYPQLRDILDSINFAVLDLREVAK